MRAGDWGMAIVELDTVSRCHVKCEEERERIDRSKNYMVTKALAEYLEKYEDDLIALDRLNDKDDRIVSGKRSRLDGEDTLRVFSRPGPKAQRLKGQREDSRSNQRRIGRQSQERRITTRRVPRPAQDQGRRPSSHLDCCRRGCAHLEN